MYNPGDTDVSINVYEIFIRSHRTAETVDHLQKLKALVWDFQVGAIDVDAIGDITALNRVYGIDALSASVTLDLDSLTPTPQTNDVIIFYVVNGTNPISIIDSGGDLEINDWNGVPENGTPGEAISIIYDFDSSGKWERLYVQNDTGAQKREYVKIGQCEEKPYIKTGTGNVKNLSGGYEKDVSETLEYSGKDLQVNHDNDEFLRSTLRNDDIDLIFYCKTEGNISTEKSIRLNEIPFHSMLNVVGNDVNFNEIVSKKTVPNVDIYLKMGLDS